MTECPICCEKYNNSTKKNITCPYNECEFTACKTCIRTYLLNTSADPNCMNCKKPFNDEFLVDNLNKTFCNTEYKKHRKEFLLEREISKLPESIEAAEKEKRIINIQDKNEEITIKIKELNNQLHHLKFERNMNLNNIYKIRNGSDNVLERRKFIMCCPNNNCRGYLSTQYKCDLCELFTCPHCLEIIGHSQNDPHTCNPDNIATAELIKKDTKPCPQCGVRIHKTQGCNQMWCTQCKVAFDYVTLKIDTGNVHNPHYYEHLQNLNNGLTPRNPQDVLCGGLCNYTDITNILNHIWKTMMILSNEEYKSFASKIKNIHRCISHITYYELVTTRTLVRELQDNNNLRIKYILGYNNKKPYSKDDFKNEIYKNDIKRKKNNDLLHILELISVVGIETFANIVNYNDYKIKYKNYNIKEYIDKQISDLNNLRIYCNNELAKISEAYNCSILSITNKWEILKVKY